jgi:hypothetical protein
LAPKRLSDADVLVSNAAGNLQMVAYESTTQRTLERKDRK